MIENMLKPGILILRLVVLGALLLVAACGGDIGGGVPSAPGAARVTPGDSRLSLSWDSAAGVTAYTVWYAASSETGSAVQSGGDISGTSAVITGLANNTRYYVWVKAKSPGGVSAFGAMSSGTPVADESPVAIPAGSEAEWSIAAAVDNGAFDNARPMANSVYDPGSNTTFAAYLGGVDEASAGIYAFSFNHTTQTRFGPVPLFIFSANGTGNDGHSYPQIVRSFDGHIHVFFVNQRSLNGNDPHGNFHIRFNDPGTIQTGFTSERLIYGGTGLFGRAGTAPIQGEYPKAIVARDGTMYYFTRAVPTSSNEPTFTFDGKSYRVAYRSQIYLKSTDNGLTWNAAKLAIGRYNLVDFLTEPYLTQVIAEPARDGVPERFHFVWTLAAGLDMYYNAAGTLVYNYHNGYSKNLYHAYFVPATAHFHSMDGTDLGESIDGTEMDAKCVVTITGNATIPPVPMTNAQHLALSSSPSLTSIMGNIASIDGDGGVIVNGRYRWNGSGWTDAGVWPEDVRFAEWRDGSHYAYQQNGAVYKSTNGLDSWVRLGSIFDDAAGVAKLPLPLQTLRGSARITATGYPSHPQARYWYKKYGDTTFSGYVVLGGHRSSQTASKLLAQVDRGRVNAGDTLTLHIYLTDNWGARVFQEGGNVTVSSSLSAPFQATTLKGKASVDIAVPPTASAGEHKITVSGAGLQSHVVYVTVN